MKFNRFTPLFLTVLFSFSLSLDHTDAQRLIKGVILHYDKPEKDVKISIEGIKSTSDIFTNENGEFSITVPEGAKTLEFQEKGDSHSHRLKLNPKDTSSFLTINLDKLLGIYSWKIETSLAASSSYFSTYQSSGNNNNLSSVLAKALIHLEWKKGEYSWLTDFNLLYGQSFTKLRIEDAQGIRTASVNAKSGDLLSITTSFAQQFTKTMHLTALLNFQSQFAKGYSDPYATARGNPLNIISDFLSPATINLGIGIDYRPNNYLNIYYSPVGLEILAVRIPELREQFDLFDKSAVFEFGSFLSMNYRKEIMKNVTFATKLQMFTNYLKNEKFPQAERPGSVDIQLWQNSLNFNFNRYFSLAITTTVIYDEDRKFRILEGGSKLGANTGRTGPRVQYFHNIGLGLNYSFFSKKH